MLRMVTTRIGGLAVVVTVAVAVAVGVVAPAGSVVAATSVTFKDPAKDFTKAKKWERVPRVYRRLPDTTGVTVASVNGRVVTTFRMVKVMAADGHHEQLVLTNAAVRTHSVSLLGSVNGKPLLYVDGQRVCRKKVVARYLVKAHLIRLSYPVSCLPAGRRMTGLTGVAMAHYAVVKGKKHYTGEVGQDVVQRAWPDPVKIR